MELHPQLHTTLLLFWVRIFLSCTGRLWTQNLPALESESALPHWHLVRNQVQNQIVAWHLTTLKGMWETFPVSAGTVGKLWNRLRRCLIYLLPQEGTAVTSRPTLGGGRSGKCCPELVTSLIEDFWDWQNIIGLGNKEWCLAGSQNDSSTPSCLH